ncbi:MAG: helix-turn-helix transcriptional regulator, partial [Pseudomonadota bacterium]
MQIITDKRDRAGVFRQRLSQAIGGAGVTQSALSRQVGVDRSTISQLLRDEGPRLPNAQLVAECAAALGVSADWLLGLSDRPEQASDLVAAALTVTEAPRALVDERIFAWHREAQGYKIRHVPAGLPDMLKSNDMLRWEYEPSLGRTTDQAIGASQDRLDWMRGARSDYEIALPVHDLHAMARAEGYYRDLPRDIRDGQLARMSELHDQLYPRLRLHLFDARR